MTQARIFRRVDGALQRYLRPPLREVVRRLVYAPVDLIEWATGSSRPGLPPRGLRFVGAGDYVAVGDEFRDLLVSRGLITPTSSVADIGCGIGRIALPLTRVLGPDGTYHGFDISKSAIRWASRHVSPLHPGFHFHHVDGRNAEYNPRGRFDPSTLEFPLADGEFNLAIAVSLHTHLLGAASAHYFEETARILQPGGLGLATLFLINDETRDLARSGLGTYSFRHAHGSAFVEYPDNPEAAVGHREDEVLDRLRDSGLEPRQPILRGSWCGRTQYEGFQDAVIFQRTNRSQGAT